MEQEPLSCGKDGLRFVKPGTIGRGATLYINWNDFGESGANVLNRSFRGAGRFASYLVDATLSVGDVGAVTTGTTPQASSVSLSSFGLYGNLDLWTPQGGTIIDRVSVSNWTAPVSRGYSVKSVMWSLRNDLRLYRRPYSA